MGRAMPRLPRPEQPAEAEKLCAAIAANLKELGHGG